MRCVLRFKTYGNTDDKTISVIFPDMSTSNFPPQPAKANAMKQL